MLISVGELNSNKNNKMAISALGRTKSNCIHHVFCGEGKKKSELYQQAQKLKVEKYVHFLGYRSDIKELFNASDIFVTVSFREGLSRALMEAMASGLPCIASRIRGNVDLLEDGKGGYLVLADDVDVIAEKINLLVDNYSLRKQMTGNNLVRILDFDSENVRKEVVKIYKNELKRRG